MNDWLASIHRAQTSLTDRKYWSGLVQQRLGLGRFPLDRCRIANSRSIIANHWALVWPTLRIVLEFVGSDGWKRFSSSSATLSRPPPSHRRCRSCRSSRDVNRKDQRSNRISRHFRVQLLRRSADPFSIVCCSVRRWSRDHLLDRADRQPIRSKFESHRSQ